MAQRHGGRGTRGRRFPGPGGGITRPQVIACVLGLGLLLALGVWRSVTSGGFEVERGSAAAEAADSSNGNAAGEGGGALASNADAGRSDEAGQGVVSPAGGAEAPARVVVHVDGAVARPGVYELAGSDPRVGDAVDAAGGLAPEADTSTLNLAAKVADGSKVHVPAAGEAIAGAQTNEGPGGASGAAAAGTQASASGAAGATSGAVAGTSGLVNINTATAEELDALPGVGPSTAQAIVEDRERNGPFSSPEDLMRVSGIGEKKFAKLEGSICV